MLIDLITKIKKEQKGFINRIFMKSNPIKEKYKNRKKRLKLKYREDKLAIREEYLADVDNYALTVGKTPPVNPPKRALLEEIGNAVTHGLGSAFAVVALVLMCIASDGAREYAGALCYFVGEMLMFTFSCLYHAFRNGSAVKRLFRRFDYSSIYLMIGGTFAPILLAYSKSQSSIWFFVIQWVLIATGITFIGVFGPTRLRWLHMPLYLLLGWCGLMLIPEMLARGDYLLFGLILGGGAVYSVGVIPFAMKGKVAHFIWHIFVLAGAIVQWIGIYSVIYLT